MSADEIETGYDFCGRGQRVPVMEFTTVGFSVPVRQTLLSGDAVLAGTRRQPGAGAANQDFETLEMEVAQLHK